MIDQIENQSIEIIQLLEREMGGYKSNKPTQKKIRQYIVEYGHQELTKAIYISIGRYLKFNKENHVIKESIPECLKKINGILYNRKLEKEGGFEYKLVNLKRKVKNKFSRHNDLVLTMYFKQCELIDCEVEELEKILKKSKKWIAWREGMDAYFTLKLREIPKEKDRLKYLHDGFSKYCDFSSESLRNLTEN